MRRSLALLLALGAATPALAADVKLCVIDAQSALNETNEGKAARDRLEGMYASKKTEIEKMQTELEKELGDYEQRKMILSDAAKAEQEKGLMAKQQKYQLAVMNAEQEMQQTYGQLLAGMEEKLLKVAEAMGAKQGCTLLIPKETTIYVGAGVVDLTQQVINDLNGVK
ncbi:MAG: OmpH family outer membrane protein [Alphaproteobacteria bacterium]|nr:OmpH family outer membrane protein [Alphaproteobacteria bacterium]